MTEPAPRPERGASRPARSTSSSQPLALHCRVSTEEILAAALALPEADRRVLLERLADSLPEEEDAAFEAEMDRCEADFDANSVPGDVVFAELTEKLARELPRSLDAKLVSR